jgi:CHAT domain-containing protein/tetratricopeptide (TPR) repeat protein
MTLAVPALGQPANEVVRELYERWSRGDAVGVRALWTEARRARATEAMAATGCVVFDSLVIDKNETAAGSEVRIMVDGIVTRMHAGTRWRTYSDPHRAIVTLEKHGQSWQITDWRLREEELVSALAGATSEAGRETLLALAVDLQTPALAQLLERRAIDAINKGEFALARELLRIMERLAVQLSDKRVQAEAFGVASILLRWDPEDFAKSLALAREASSAAVQASDPDVLARSQQRLGRAQMFAGASAEASPALEQALDLADDLIDATPAALAATDLARLQEERRNYRLALVYATEALRHAERTGNANAIINASQIVAALYNGQGDVRLAEPYFERALNVARAHGFLHAMVVEATGLGIVAIKAGDLATAGKWVEKARSYSEAESSTNPDPYKLRGWISIVEKKYDEAERDLREAACIGNDESGLAQSMAFIKLEIGDTDAASRWLDRAETLAPASNATRLFRARVSLARGAIDEAVATLIDIVDIEERVVDMASSGIGQQIASLGTVDEVYRLLIDALIARGSTLEAFRYSERMRARLLRTFLAGKRVNLRNELSIEERSRHTRMIEELQSLNREIVMLREGSGEWPAVHKKLDRARLELEDYESRLLTIKATGAVAAITNDTAGLPSVPAGEVVLSYVTNKSTTIIFILDAGTAGKTRLRVRTVAIASSDLTRRVDSLMKALEQRRIRYGREAAALYALLIQPIAPLLRGRHAVTIVPDGALWNVPFHALKDGEGRYLIERLAVSYAPVVGFLDATRFASRDSSARPTRDLLAFADPTASTAALQKTFASLPEAAREVRQAASLYRTGQTSIRVGAAAQEQLLKREGGRYRILHFATHGIVDVNAPLFSAVLLAPGGGEDGLLEVREIMDLRLNADLAILSACETARGPVSPGEGRISLSWAFLLAGCSTTIVSQWKADSDSTASLMIELHRQLVAGGSPSEALRRAQRKLIGSREQRHPYYWAAFAAMGRAGQVLYPSVAAGH